MPVKRVYNIKPSRDEMLREHIPYRLTHLDGQRCYGRDKNGEHQLVNYGERGSVCEAATVGPRRDRRARVGHWQDGHARRSNRRNGLQR